MTHPNSTLSSSASTTHLRRTLQALPHLPGDVRNRPRRGRVEHFVPAVWIPDGRTESCMRCGRSFGWRRRRHHCRLCGRCVCASCSGSVCWFRKTLLIRLNVALRRPSTYLSQMQRNLQNPHAPVMRATKLCFRYSRLPPLPI